MRTTRPLRIADCGLRIAARTTGRHPDPLATRRAFSLIEILVVIGLMSVIILGLLAMFNQTQRAFRTGMTQVDVLAAGRAATDMMARELSQITPASYTWDAVNFYARVQAFPPFLQPLPGTASPSELRRNLLSEVFFLTRENQTGQPRWSGIGYWVGDPVTRGPATGGWGTLYRFQTNTVFRDMPSPRAPYNYYNSGARTNLSSRIIDGVVHFKVRAFTTNGTWITPDSLDVATAMRTRMQYSPAVPAEVDYYVKPPRGGPPVYTFTNTAVPAFVEFELGILEERALARLKSIPATDLVTRSNYLAQQAGRVHLFRTRVPVRNVDPTAYQ